MKKTFSILGLAAATLAGAHAQTNYVTGPSTSTTPYLSAIAPYSGIYVDKITSFLTTKDTVGGYEMGGLPDGLGAFDNNDGTFTLLVNHEIPTNNVSVGTGINGGNGTHAHGATGAYVSQWIVNKSTLAVTSGSDLIHNVYDWNATTQASNASTSTIAFARFCSADLAASTAFYNPSNSNGTQARIFLNGEESTGGGTNGQGRALANIVTGSGAGNSYVLGKFDLSTNNNTNSLTGVGAWENLLAHPNTGNVLGDKTIVIGTSDGGTGLQNNTVGLYAGTKQSSGTDADKAGLTNGEFKFISVAGHTDGNGSTTEEFTNTTSHASVITSGTSFTLSSTSATTFSRPEDGAWDPTNSSRFYFVTTDRLDTATAAGGGQLNPTVGSSISGNVTQTGMSRLWSLTFSDITNPDAGGTIDLLIDGGKSGAKVQMFDNMTVDATGRIFMNEDPGNSTYNGKIWTYDPSNDQLTMLTKFDTSRWGDLTSANGTPGATSPFNNDKETSGILDVTSLFTSTPGTGESYLLTTAQDHSSGANADTFTVEGGQLMLLHTAPVPEPSTYALLALAGAGVFVMARRRKA